MYKIIKELYKDYYPFSDQECKRRAVYFCAVVLALYLPGVFFISLYGMNYLFFLLSAFYLFFLYSEVFFLIKAYESQKSKKNFCRILSNIRHQYYRCFSVAESVRYAAEGLHGESQKHLDKLTEILYSEDKREGMEKYKMLVCDKFYQMFLLQAASVEEHGDEQIHGSSVFLQGLGHLRREAEMEYRNEKRMGYLLAGLGMVVGIPIFFMPAIRQWAVGNLPELSAFYSGAIGRAAELTALAMTFTMYCFLRELRGAKYHPFCKEIVLKIKNIKFIRKFAENYQKNNPKVKKYGALLRRTGDGRNTEDFFLYQLFMAFLFQLSFIGIFFLFRRYEANLTIWILPAFLMPAAGYWYPIVRLKITGLILSDRMQEEILNFQFLIRMEMRLPGMTTLELLEELEENAVIFKDSLRACIRDYGKDEQEAFLTLWQKENYPPFRRLVDMFLMVDESGMEEAFSEIKDDMEEFQENRKLEVEILQQRRAEAAMLLACIPGMFILFCYLIIPFMLECFRMLENYNSSLAAM